MKKYLFIIPIVLFFTSSICYGSDTLIDSYSEANNGGNLYIDSSNISGGQCFYTGSNSYELTEAKFYLAKIGTVSGNRYAYLYASTGTCGTNAIPTGSVLATSNIFDASTLTTSKTIYSFLFTDNYILQADTYYFITYGNSTVSCGDNCEIMATDNTSPIHTGNMARKESGTWTAYNSQDTIFYVYGILQSETPPNVDNSESIVISNWFYNLLWQFNQLAIFLLACYIGTKII